MERTPLEAAQHAVNYYEDRDREWGVALDELETTRRVFGMEHQQLVLANDAARHEAYEAACEALSVLRQIAFSPDGVEITLADVFAGWVEVT